MAEECAPWIVFLDEIDAVGTKRFDTLFIIMATNRIDSLDPALIRPGRNDRKIELLKPDEKTKMKILSLHISEMTLAKDVKFERIVSKEPEISWADFRAIYTEAGMLAHPAHRKVVYIDDFDRRIKNVIYSKKCGVILCVIFF
uniref:ATPase AAA-type core domain-containing protein n=1 Tax=Panagrolaimus superbus TaxID=310955 RepID=A0A914YNT7_9BILA